MRRGKKNLSVTGMCGSFVGFLCSRFNCLRIKKKKYYNSDEFLSLTEKKLNNKSSRNKFNKNHKCLSYKCYKSYGEI